MKSVAIMQPTFLPWVGYFDLIDQADDFVFLDSVQFEKQSWQQRNRVLGHSGLEWITTPVMIKGRSRQKICDVEIKATNFPAKQLRTIKYHYERAPFFDRYWDELRSIFVSVDQSSSLAKLNMRLICWLSDCFQLKGNFKVSSEMCPERGRSDRLVEIITMLGASRYISPLGAAVYLKQDYAIFSEAGIEVRFQNYEPQPYKQLQPGFTGGTCALDILFNEGANAGSIIRAGRRDLSTFNEVCNE